MYSMILLEVPGSIASTVTTAMILASISVMVATFNKDKRQLSRGGVAIVLLLVFAIAMALDVRQDFDFRDFAIPVALVLALCAAGLFIIRHYGSIIEIFTAAFVAPQYEGIYTLQGWVLAVHLTDAYPNETAEQLIDRLAGTEWWADTSNMDWERAVELSTKSNCTVRPKAFDGTHPRGSLFHLGHVSISARDRELTQWRDLVKDAIKSPSIQDESGPRNRHDVLRLAFHRRREQIVGAVIAISRSTRGKAWFTSRPYWTVAPFNQVMECLVKEFMPADNNSKGVHVVGSSYETRLEFAQYVANKLAAVQVEPAARAA